MPVQSYWDNGDKTILRNDFEGLWTWDDYFDMIQQRNALMSSVDHRVDVIANMKPGMMPSSGAGLSSSQPGLNPVPANHGLFVIVMNTLIGTLLDVFKQFENETGITPRPAKSLEEAREIIRQDRAKDQA